MACTPFQLWGVGAGGGGKNFEKYFLGAGSEIFILVKGGVQGILKENLMWYSLGALEKPIKGAATDMRYFARIKFFRS